MAAHLLAKIRCLTNDSPFIRLPLWNFFVTQKHCVKNEENSLRGRGASNISRLEFSILIRSFESILWNLQFSRDVKFKSIPFSRGFDLELEEKNLFQGTVELFWFILYLRRRTKRWSLLWCSRKWYWYANEDREVLNREKKCIGAVLYCVIKVEIFVLGIRGIVKARWRDRDLKVGIYRRKVWFHLCILLSYDKCSRYISSFHFIFVILISQFSCFILEIIDLWFFVIDLSIR